MTNIASPISEVVIDVKRAPVDERTTTKAAIDRGCSLSKFLYIPKDTDLADTNTHYTFHCALFRNADFEGALHFFKANALLPSEGKLRVTGAGCDMYKDLIAEILGLEIDFISEFITIFKGTHFLLTHAVSRESLFYPDIEVPSMNIQRDAASEERLKRFKQMICKNDPKSEDDIFPSIFVLCSSGMGGMVIHPDGKTKFLGGTMLSGRVLMGLGQALVGTSDYTQLMELASAGDCTQIDTTVGEHIRTDPKSAYGQLPKDLPLFPFGKLAESAKPLDEYSQADRATSLIRAIAFIFTNQLFSYVNMCSMSQVIFGGNVVTGEPMRKWIIRSSRLLMPDGTVKIRFLRTGHTGAFGAMIGDPSDMQLATH